MAQVLGLHAETAGSNVVRRLAQALSAWSWSISQLSNPVHNSDACGFSSTTCIYSTRVTAQGSVPGGRQPATPTLSLHSPSKISRTKAFTDVHPQHGESSPSKRTIQAAGSLFELRHLLTHSGATLNLPKLDAAVARLEDLLLQASSIKPGFRSHPSHQAHVASTYEEQKATKVCLEILGEALDARQDWDAELGFRFCKLHLAAASRFYPKVRVVKSMVERLQQEQQRNGTAALAFGMLDLLARMQWTDQGVLYDLCTLLRPAAGTLSQAQAVSLLQTLASIDLMPRPRALIADTWHHLAKQLSIHDVHNACDGIVAVADLCRDNFKPSRWKQVEQIMVSQAHRLSPQQLADILLACIRVRRLSQPLSLALSDAIVTSLDSFTPHQLVSIAHSCSQCHPADKNLLHAVVLSALPYLAELHIRDAIDLLWAASINNIHDPSLLQQCLQTVQKIGLKNVLERDGVQRLVKLYWSVSAAQQSDKELMHPLQSCIYSKLHELTSEELATLAVACSKHPQPDCVFLRLVLEAAQRLMQGTSEMGMLPGPMLSPGGITAAWPLTCSTLTPGVSVELLMPDGQCTLPPLPSQQQLSSYLSGTMPLPSFESFSLASKAALPHHDSRSVQHANPFYAPDSHAQLVKHQHKAPSRRISLFKSISQQDKQQPLAAAAYQSPVVTHSAAPSHPPAPVSGTRVSPLQSQHQTSVGATRQGSRLPKSVTQRALALLTCAVAQLHYREPRVLDFWLTHVHANVLALDLNCLSAMAWACARLGVRSRDLWDRVLHAAGRKADKLQARHIADLLWALGTTLHGQIEPQDPVAATLGHIFQRAESTVPYLNAQQLLDVAWSSTRLGVSPPKLFSKLAHHIQGHLDSMTGSQLSVLTWSFTGASYSEPWFYDKVATRLASQLNHLPEAEVLLAAWCFSRGLPTYRNEHLLREAAEVCSTWVPASDAQLLHKLCVIFFCSSSGHVAASDHQSQQYASLHLRLGQRACQLLTSSSLSKSDEASLQFVCACLLQQDPSCTAAVRLAFTVSQAHDVADVFAMVYG